MEIRLPATLTAEYEADPAGGPGWVVFLFGLVEIGRIPVTNLSQAARLSAASSDEERELEVCQIACRFLSNAWGLSSREGPR